MIQRMVFVLSLGMATVGAAFSQEFDTLFSGMATFDSGLVVRYATTAARTGDLNLGGWGAGEVLSEVRPTRTPGVETQQLQRYFIDSARNLYFGYKLRVARSNFVIPAGSRSGRPIQLWIEPLSLTVQDLPERFRKPLLRRVDLHTYPASQRIGYDDSIVIDLTIAGRDGNADGTLQLQETLRFSPAGVRSLPLGE